MFGGNNGISLADIAAVTRNNNNGEFGTGNGWWILIILFALFGWGNNGFGGNRGGCNCGSNGGVAYVPYGVGGSNEGYQLTTDVATLERKLDGVNNGICSLGYDQLGQINNVRADLAAGFSGVNNAVCTLGYQNAQLINGVQTSLMQNTNTLQAQLADCCCQNREAIAQVRYDMATDTCAITTAMNQGFQNVMQNCNNNYRQLHDEMISARMEAKDETIAMLRQELAFRNTQEVNAVQTERITNVVNDAFNRTHPQAIPAFTVPNPYVPVGYGCCNQQTGGCCR